jgi:nitrite reductase/ring-hydroxylating ferredoxin subunit
MTTIVEREYKRLRDKGYRAREAINGARVKEKWVGYGGYEIAQWDMKYRGEPDGEVRIVVREDDDYELAMDFECEDKRCAYAFTNGRMNLRQGKHVACKIHKAVMKRLEQEGMCGVVGEYKHPVTGVWIEVDSCWGFVGDDWKDSGYDVDVMSEVMREREKVMGC